MPLISLDIQTLRAFVSVIKTGRVTEAARLLGRSQPAISLQLQRFEEQTKKQLFYHEGLRLVHITQGDLVLSYAKSILRQHELLQNLASPDVAGNVGLGTP